MFTQTHSHTSINKIRIKLTTRVLANDNNNNSNGEHTHTQTQTIIQTCENKFYLVVYKQSKWTVVQPKNNGRKQIETKFKNEKRIIKIIIGINLNKNICALKRNIKLHNFKIEIRAVFKKKNLCKIQNHLLFSRLCFCPCVKKSCCLKLALIAF